MAIVELILLKQFCLINIEINLIALKSLIHLFIGEYDK